MDEELRNAIELSIDDFTQKLEETAINESFNMESERICNLKKNERKKSLQEFSKRIKSLSFSSDEIEIKNFIEKILDDYFNLRIDSVYIEEDMFIKIYKIIDSYYFIPNQKKFKKTAISSEEDRIIRNIILKFSE